MLFFLLYQKPETSKMSLNTEKLFIKIEQMYDHTKILISLWKFEEIILHQKEVGGKGNI
jgi:hypothetical protein